MEYETYRRWLAVMFFLEKIDILSRHEIRVLLNEATEREYKFWVSKQ